jgi:hypothetical protein
MVHLLAAMTSCGLLVLACALVTHTLRQSGTAVLSALVGEQTRPLAQVRQSIHPVVRIKNSTRAQSVSPRLQMRAAA